MKKYNKLNKKNIKIEHKSIFERFSTKENIIIFSFVLIFMIILWNLISSYDPYSKINYDKYDLDNFLGESTIHNNRDDYWILNDIILNFLHSGDSDFVSNNGESTIQTQYYKYSTKEYYKALNDDYNKFLSEEEYLNLANKVINTYDENYENLKNVVQEVPIRKIYKCNLSSNDEYFLVKLNTSVDTYIGIQLDKKNHKFYIFYLE